MSIQSEITRITNKRDASLAKVANKGVSVPSGSTMDDLPDLIDLIVVDPTYSISKIFTNITSSNDDTKVIAGNSFYADLIPTSGYLISSITVTMGGVDITDQVFKPGTGAKPITANGTYNAASDNLSGYSSVVVNVPSQAPNLGIKNITANGTYSASSDNLDGYSQVTVNVSGGSPSGTKQISISSNGMTTEDVASYASAEISVNVPNSYVATDEGKVVSNGTLVSQTSSSTTQNGMIDTTLINSLLVNVVGGNSVKTGTVTPSAASTTISFDAGLSTITGILVMPINTPLTGSRTQAAMICLPSGSFYKAISIHTNNGGTGWVSPSVYTSNRYSLSGTTVTVTGAYSFRPNVGYIWYAW